MEKGNVKITIINEGIRSLVQQVKQISHGGRVLFFTEQGRQAEDARAALTFEGMQILTKEVPEKPADSLFSELQKPPEGIMAAVAVGGPTVMEAAKAAHLPSAIPKLLFPTTFAALCGADERVFIGTKADLPRCRSTGHDVLIDPKTIAASPLRPGLGFLIANITEQADAAYERLILSGESPASALRLLKEKAALLLEIREENAAEDTVSAALKLIKTSEELSDSAHMLALLAERRTGGNFTDHLFPAAYALLRLYAGYLGSLPLEHCPPPDRDENLRLLQVKCGVNPSLLWKRQKTYAEGYDNRWRLTAEYREDFAEAIGEKAVPLSLLSRLYRRAPEEKTCPQLSAIELLLLLSLTGEAVSGYPLIKHVKMTGLLEPLLRCG